MAMVELKNISHAYNQKEVLHSLSLTIQDNQLTCLLGGSGSGKTTLLRLIAGLEKPQVGIISVNGEVVTKNGTIFIEPNQRKIGFIFQDLALWPHFSIFENIAFGLKEKKEHDIEKKVGDILKFFGIESEINKFPHQLSGGQQQLVAISRALVLKPQILLMDEPLANLDVKLKRKILDYIKNLIVNFNLTIIYVTHDHREAFAIADKIVVLNDGKIEEEGSPEAIKSSKNKFIQYFLEY